MKLSHLRTLLSAIPLALELAKMAKDAAEDIGELRTRLARKAMAGDLDDSLRRIK